MTALGLFIYTISALGFAYVVGHAKITQRFRERLWGVAETEGGDPITLRQWLVALLECPACCGWYVGLGAGLYLALAGSPGPSWLLPVAGAFYTAGSNFILGKLLGLMPD